MPQRKYGERNGRRVEVAGPEGHGALGARVSSPVSEEAEVEGRAEGAERGGASDPPAPRWLTLAWCAGMLLVLAAGALLHFGPAFAEGFSSHVPLRRQVIPDQELSEADLIYRRRMMALDGQYTAWAIARNARTLLESPSALFEAEKCYPVPNSLAYGEHAIALSLLATPAHLLGADPIGTFNGLLVLYVLYSGLAVFALVWAWTREPGAALIAGASFALAAWRLDVAHLFVFDYGWLALALLFAERASRRGRGIDVALAALFCSLQIATSFYPMLGALMFLLPLGVWLLARRGARKIRPLHAALAVAWIFGVAWAVHAPYLEVRASDVEVANRGMQFFFSWSSVMPTKLYFPGWLTLALCVCAIAFGRRAAPRGIPGDPRAVLVIGALLALYLAANGNLSARLMAQGAGEDLPVALPRLYSLLSSFLPGLGNVRAPAAIAGVLGLAAAILAGIGAAACLDRLRGWQRPLFVGVAVAWIGLGTLRPDSFDGRARTVFEAEDLSPDAATLAFFRELEARGSAGPVLELPVEVGGLGGPRAKSDRVFLSNYHLRATSACVGSYRPEATKRLAALERTLRDPRTLREIEGMGFTTIVVHHPEGPLGRDGKQRLTQLMLAARTPARPLRMVLQENGMSAFTLVGRATGAPAEVEEGKQQ